MNLLFERETGQHAMQAVNLSLLLLRPTERLRPNRRRA